MSNIVIIRDDIHPLLNKIVEYIELTKVSVDIVYWKDIFLYDFSDTKVVFMDRMGEKYPTYETQILYVEKLFENLNISVVNKPSTYIWTRNKILSDIYFKKLGFTIPKSYIISNIKQFEQIEIDKIIAKPYLGACSEGVIPFKKDNVPKEVRELLDCDGMIIVQEFICNPDQYIWRVDLVDGEIIQINRRYSYNNSNEFPICNGTYGGKLDVINPSETPDNVKSLVDEVYSKIGLDIMGIDLLVDKTGKLYLLEVNPEPDITLDFLQFPHKIAHFLISKMEG